MRDTSVTRRGLGNPAGRVLIGSRTGAGLRLPRQWTATLERQRRERLTSSAPLATPVVRSVVC